MPSRAALLAHRIKPGLPAVVGIALLALLVPNVAFADTLGDQLVNFLFKPFYEALATVTAATIVAVKDAADEGFKYVNVSLTTSGAGLSTTQANVPMDGFANVVVAVTKGIMPVCYTVLGIVFAIRMIKALQEPDNGPGNVPYIEKFAWLWIKFCLLKLVMDNSVGITIGLFNEIIRIIDIVGAAAFTGAGQPLDAGALKDQIVQSLVDAKRAIGPGDAVVAVLMGLLTFLASMALELIVFVATYGRWAQVWVCLCFAPLFFSFAGLDETKGMFWSYLKTMAGLALAFVMTAILLKAMVPVLTAFATNGMTNLASGLIGIEIVFIFALMKVGSWSRDLIGG